jgi:hypothetical protein
MPTETAGPTGAAEVRPKECGGKDSITDSIQVKRKNVRHVHDEGIRNVLLNKPARFWHDSESNSGRERIPGR